MLAPYPGLTTPQVGPQPDSVKLQDGAQCEFAEAIHLPLDTLKNWEQHRTAMDPATLALMTILAWSRRRRCALGKKAA